MCIVEKWDVCYGDGKREHNERVLPCSKGDSYNLCSQCEFRALNDQFLPARPPVQYPDRRRSPKPVKEPVVPKRAFSGTEQQSKKKKDDPQLEFDIRYPFASRKKEATKTASKDADVIEIRSPPPRRSSPQRRYPSPQRIRLEPNASTEARQPRQVQYSPRYRTQRSPDGEARRREEIIARGDRQEQALKLREEEVLRRGIRDREEQALGLLGEEVLRRVIRNREEQALGLLGEEVLQSANRDREEYVSLRGEDLSQQVKQRVQELDAVSASETSRNTSLESPSHDFRRDEVQHGTRPMQESLDSGNTFAHATQDDHVISVAGHGHAPKQDKGRNQIWQPEVAELEDAITHIDTAPSTPELSSLAKFNSADLGTTDHLGPDAGLHTWSPEPIQNVEPYSWSSINYEKFHDPSQIESSIGPFDMPLSLVLDPEMACGSYTSPTRNIELTFPTPWHAESFRSAFAGASECWDSRKELAKGAVRSGVLYEAIAYSDGLYHCPFRGKENCDHPPEKLKFNYDKHLDTHLRPYKCVILPCNHDSFSSTACLRRHEREVHGMDGYRESPYLCMYKGCDRSIKGNGFPRRWNLQDHEKRCHNDAPLNLGTFTCPVCSKVLTSSTSLLRHDVEKHSEALITQQATELPGEADLSSDDSDDSQSESVFTRQNRCSSISSMPRIPIWREARDIIVPIISENTALKLLYHHALNDGGMAFDLFEHRFRELLRQYCSDLKAEANDIPRKEAVKVLKLSTDKIVYEIHELCGPADHVSKERLALLKQQKAKKHEEVEQYLRKTVGLSYDKPGPEATDERVDDMEADESDPDDDRVSEHLFPNIHTIKTFFVSGTPFTRLHENLHDFVFPSQETKKDVDSSTEKVQFPPKPEIDKALWKDYRQSMPQLGMYDLLVASLQYLSQYLNNSMQAWTNDHFKVSQVQSFIHELRMKVRPSVIAGHQRITWRCGCGKHMYADVEELYPGGAESLQTSLRRAAADAIWIDNQLAHDTFTNLGINTELIQLTTNSTRSHHQSSNNNSRSSQISTGMSTSTETLHGPVLSTSSTSTTLAGTDLSLSSSGETISDQPQATLQQQFLLLCISTPRTAKLEQIRIPYSADDQVMFQDIRRAYLKVRQTRTQTFHPETPDFIRRLITKGYVLLHLTQKITIQLFHFLRLRWLVWWIGDLVFYIPTSANFVRFELIPIKTEICPEVLSFPDLPPSEEVHVKKTYHYTPCPQSVRNPVLRIPYLHVLFEPGNHLDRFWSNRVPKKLNSEIRYGDGVEPVIGWGVHVVEGPNWVAFSVLSEIVLLLSGVLALGWSLLARDVSAGFTVGAYVVAVLAVGNALGIVMLCQQH